MTTAAELARFAEYLIQNGAHILDPIEDDEAMRYQFGDDVISLRRTGKNRLNMRGIVALHYLKFRENRALVIYGRVKVDRRRKLTKRIRERDGDRCCYCNEPLEGDETIEHWLSLRHGGNNTLANMALAHSACNRKAGSLSVSDKMKLRHVLTERAAQKRAQAAMDAETSGSQGRVIVKFPQVAIR